MPEPSPPTDASAEDLHAEIARLHEIIRALMDRAERSTSLQSSDFGVFQSTIMVEDQVRRRTAHLQAAVRENERITRDLRESEARFRGVVAQSLVGITMIENGKFSYTNAKYDEMFGYDAHELRRLGPLDLVLDADRPVVMEALRKRLEGDADTVEYVFRGRRRDGAVIDLECHGSVMDLDGRRVLISVLRDITDRTRAEREINALQELLRRQATRDSLTGLHNRRYLEESLRRELTCARLEQYPVSVIMSDLDHFKTINDRFGHLAGDEVLRAFARLIEGHVRGIDIACRYGGEEFLVVLRGMSGDMAGERAEQLRRSVERTPVKTGGAAIAMTASFGVACFPHDGQTTDTLIAAADDALYAAKAAGRNRVHASATPNGSKPSSRRQTYDCRR